MKRLLGIMLIFGTGFTMSACKTDENPSDDNIETPEVPEIPGEQLPEETKSVLGINFKFDFSNLKEERFNYIIDGSLSNIDTAGTVKKFNTIQSFLDYSKTITEEVVVFIRDGRYYEKLTIEKANLVLIGESAENTIITYDDASGTPAGTGTVGTSGSASVTIKSSARGFTAMNLTFENGFDEVANAHISSKQAVAVKSEADMSVYYKVRFIGNQDTLYPDKGRHFFYDCYIEGDVDFIFGGGNIVIDNSIIHSVDRGTTPKGYVVAPRTNNGITSDALKSEFGFVIMNSKLTSDMNITGVADDRLVKLGRPWGADAKAVFLDSDFGKHISGNRWTDMSPNLATNAFFREYNITGDGEKDTSTGRWMLDSNDYMKYQVDNVFANIPSYKTEFNVLGTLTRITNLVK